MSRLSKQDPDWAKGDQHSSSHKEQQPNGLDLPTAEVGNNAFWLSVPSVLYESTANLVVTSISPNTIELIGIQSENVVGKRSLFEDRMCLKDSAILEERIARLEPPDIVSVVQAIADDRGLPVWVAHSLRKVQTGCELRIVGCLTPVGRELITSKLESSIVAQFTHKIGNHFQLINLLIGALKRSGTNAEDVEVLQQTIDRAVDFTRSFSRFSQPPVCTGAVDIGDILHSATKSMSLAWAEKNIVFQYVKVPRALMNGDAFLLEQAFGAVLQNAFEASHPGNRIVVDGRVEREWKTRQPIVRITVVDNGVGIGADMMALAAEPFVSSKRDRDGLGLSTAVRIIELHGGSLRLASSPGLGTEVEIVLPLNSGWEEADSKQRDTSESHVQRSNS